MKNIAEKYFCVDISGAKERGGLNAILYSENVNQNKDISSCKQLKSQ